LSRDKSPNDAKDNKETEEKKYKNNSSIHTIYEQKKGW
jgi:hypothetical protein